MVETIALAQPLKKSDYNLQSVWKQYKSEFYGTGDPDSAVDSDVTMGVKDFSGFFLFAW